MFRNILIATDGSPLSGKGVEMGLDLARSAQASVTILTVSEPFPTYDLGSHFGLFQDREAIAKYDSDCRTMAEAILTAAQESAATAEVACETLHVANEAPARAILATAKSLGADLIVVTSNGRRGFDRLMLGSQAAKVVQGAETSVLVVR